MPAPIEEDRVTDAMVHAYKHSFGEYMHKVEFGHITPPTPDVGFNATKYALGVALAPSQEVPDMDGAIAEIAAERQRQIESEGWAPEHEDQHDRGQMATAAGCYIMHASHLGSELELFWPWSPEWWKPTDRRRDLVKAGALIAAEIERLDRAEKRRVGLAGARVVTCIAALRGCLGAMWELHPWKSREEFEADPAVQAARTAIAAAPGDMVLVPREPTTAMLNAYAGTSEQRSRYVWDAMLAAAQADYEGRIRSALAPATQAVPEACVECHKSDTPDRVCFYEQDFYVLSNFSSFSIMWEWTPRDGLVRFDTSEAVYHFMKFKATVPTAQQFQLMERIRRAPSAHEAFKIAESNKHHRRPDWDDVKVDIMRDILRAKAEQHEYVRRKLLATGDRELVEDSWRDDFWGWGPNRDGKNMLGQLWMEIRAELRAHSTEAADHG